MYQMKRFIDIEGSPLSMFLLLSNWFVFSQLHIYHFCIMIKDLSISFSRVIIIRDLKTVTFDLLLVDKPTFAVVFY